MTLTKTQTPGGPRRVDVEALLRLIASLVVGHIRERTGKGLDVDDKPFKPYSEDYAADRAALGRNTSPVTMLMTGGMVGSVGIVDEDADSVTIGLGTGTSPQLSPPTRTRRRKTTGKRGPPHNLLGRWHQEGQGNNPKRRWFGVSPRGDKAIRRQVQDGKPPLKG
jgi:hypothetical protein